MAGASDALEGHLFIGDLDEHERLILVITHGREVRLFEVAATELPGGS